MTPKFTLVLTDSAATTYRRLWLAAQECSRRGDVANSQVTAFRKLEEILDETVPQDPFNRERLLFGSLSGIFQITDEPVRVAYIGSPQNTQITVVHISETALKAGYNVFAKLVLDQDDEILKQLGVDPPDRSSPAKKPSLQ